MKKMLDNPNKDPRPSGSTRRALLAADRERAKVEGAKRVKSSSATGFVLPAYVEYMSTEARKAQQQKKRKAAESSEQPSTKRARK